MEKVSVIIAARNEEARIGNVLKVVSRHHLVDDIVVMCDNCSDNTADVARRFRKVHVVEHEERQGKTLAVKHGLDHVKNETIMLIDADLQNLLDQNITDLATPVLEQRVDFTLSLRGNSTLIFKLLGIDFLSGERAIKRNLLHEESIWSKPKVCFSLEILMNDSLLRRNKTFISVSLPNLYQTPKNEKMNFFKGCASEVYMFLTIINIYSLHKYCWQFLKMSYLNNKYQKSTILKQKNGYEELA